jgi:phosphohistidine phosphatase
MKTLHIVRHGKALQDYLYIADYDRPLIEKGILNNVEKAKQLLENYSVPDLIVSSYAARALHTAHIFAQVMGYPHERVRVNERLYSDGETEMHKILKNLPDEIASVMIVGHNPDVTFVANTYTGRSIDSITTSGIVSIRFNTNRWHEIDKANSDL